MLEGITLAEPAQKKKFTLIKKRDRQEKEVPVSDTVPTTVTVTTETTKETTKEKGGIQIKDLIQLVSLSFIHKNTLTLTSTEMGLSVRALARKMYTRRNEKNLIPKEKLLQSLRPILDEGGFVFVHCSERLLVTRDEDYIWSAVTITTTDTPEEKGDLEEIVLQNEMLDLLAIGADDEADEVEKFDLSKLTMGNDKLLPRLSDTTCQGLYDYFSVNIQPFILTDDRSAFLNRLTGALNAGLQKIPYPPNTQGRAPPISVKFFGSSVNNLGFTESDADMCIVLAEGERSVPDHPYQNMYKVSKVLRKHYKDIVTVAQARVPIVKFYDPATKLECDINFNHALGVENSALLASYTHLDPRVQPLIMMIKYFVKRKGINDASRDSISSYAYTLMAIAYLQHRGILGNLQSAHQGPRKVISVPEVNLQRRGKPQRKGVVGSRTVDVSFKSVQPPQGKEVVDWSGPEGVANLFLDFLDYFANKHVYRSHSVVSVKEGGIKILPAIDNKVLVVMDPFEEERNTTRMVDGASLKRIKGEFLQAIRLLQNGSIKQAFKIVRLI